MLHPDDIHSMTDFLRNAKAYARKLKKTGRPAVLTVNGEAELVVQAPQHYQHLLSKAEELDAFKVLRQSIADMKAGRGRPLDEVLNDMETRLAKKSRTKPRRKK